MCFIQSHEEARMDFFMSNLHKAKVIHNDSLPRPNKALCQDFEEDFEATVLINCSLPDCPASRKLEQQYIPVCVVFRIWE